jgi:uncharacterized protein with von Willebrand factor type A (vWA) domain
MITRGGGPAARIGRFIAHLRSHGFVLGPGETELALSVLAGEELPDAKAARLALKALFSGNRDEWSRFDTLFDAYWFGRGTRSIEPSAAASDRSRLPDIWRKALPADPSARAPGGSEHIAGLDGTQEGNGIGRLIASPNDTRSQTDLRTLSTPEEIAEAERIAERLARAIRYRLTRRRRPARRGEGIDLRRTIRRNLSRGGEPLELWRKERPERPVRLVVLLDVSGSMQLYSVKRYASGTRAAPWRGCRCSPGGSAEGPKSQRR